MMKWKSQYKEPMDELIERLVNRTAFNLSRQIDRQIHYALRKYSPISNWLINRFPYRWMARLLRMELTSTKSLVDIGWTYRFYVNGRLIHDFKVDIAPIESFYD